MTTARLLTCAVIAMTAVVAGVAPAAAHVQVIPSTAAPDDAVKWEVLVPNEDEAPTTKVELAIPPGVIPFSYQDVPGWRRSLTLKKDGSVRSIVWRGRLRPHSFASFEFLASTPPTEGELAWKAIQTYQGGRKVRWIEPADGENPAAFTTVSKRFPAQNAGGEGSGETAAAEPAATETSADGDGSDTTARWLAAGALAAALAALAVALLRRPRGGS
jgi:Domain of unkown function (DUF1775)